MKKIILCLLVILFGISFISCNETNNSNNNNSNNSNSNNNDNNNNNGGNTNTPSGKKTLVVYFSKTNTTEKYALELKNLVDADIFEVQRKEEYPEDYSQTTQIAKEEKDNNARPELKEYMSKDDMSNYDTIFLGFPIWYGTVPMPILTFLEYYDLNGKTIYTFCTSGGSGISGSTSDVKKSSQGANVIEGIRIRNNDQLNDWISKLK